MSTTTIRLDDDLKSRIAAVAQRADKSAHAFIVEAIVQRVEEAEIEAQWHAMADKRWAKALKSGVTIAWVDAKPYLEARARGERPPRPKARRLRTDAP